jgi:hypothetical protein
MIARTLRQLGMSLGVFVVAVGGNENRLFTTGESDNPKKFASACRMRWQWPNVSMPNG